MPPSAWTLLALVVLAVVVGGPLVLTARGSRRRGNGFTAAAFAGVLFPATWVVWYLHDERPGYAGK